MLPFILLILIVILVNISVVHAHNSDNEGENETTGESADEIQKSDIIELFLALINHIPDSTQLIITPYPQGFYVYGRANIMIDQAFMIKGGQAMLIDASKSMPMAEGATAIGDTLCLLYWARRLTLPQSIADEALIIVGVEQNSEPCTKPCLTSLH